MVSAVSISFQKKQNFSLNFYTQQSAALESIFPCVSLDSFGHYLRECTCISEKTNYVVNYS